MSLYQGESSADLVAEVSADDRGGQGCFIAIFDSGLEEKTAEVPAICPSKESVQKV